MLYRFEYVHDKYLFFILYSSLAFKVNINDLGVVIF